MHYGAVLASRLAGTSEDPPRRSPQHQLGFRAPHFNTNYGLRSLTGIFFFERLLSILEVWRLQSGPVQRTPYGTDHILGQVEEPLPCKDLGPDQSLAVGS